MGLTRKQALWFATGMLVACGWCSLLSALGGWLTGYDLGQREVRATLVAAEDRVEPGVLVVRVQRDSPADRAGITRNSLITAVNGILVEDVPALQDELARYHPGDDIAVTITDERGEKTTQVRLGRLPDSEVAYLGIYYTARAEEPADL